MAAKLAIADELGLPLTKLTPDDRAFIDQVWGKRGCVASSSGGSGTTLAHNRSGEATRVDVMQHYGFTQPLSHAGYYETQHHRQLMTDIKSAILEGP